MNQPKISILLPVYGAERFIERCAVSLFEQTYDNLEYIFVNDCTKDHSIEVLQEVVERYSHRRHQVRIINHEVNKGVGEARNTLLDAATGEFLLFVDPDDYIDINLVERLVVSQKLNDSDIVLHDYKIISKRNIEVRTVKDYSSVYDYLTDMLRRQMVVAPWGKLIRSSLFCNNKIRVEKGVNASEDCMIIVRATYYAKKVSVCHGVYYYYDNTNMNSITSSFSPVKVKDDYKAFDFLNEFFKDKKDYYLAFQEGALTMYMQKIVESALHRNKQCFNEAQKNIKALDGDILKKLSFFDKLLLNTNVGFAHVYVKWGLYLKSFLRMHSK